MPKSTVAKVSKPKADKKKDPNAPKRPLSAFMFYSTAQRAEIKKNNPEASFGELGKLIGQKWKELSDSEKTPYNKKAAEAKAAYEKIKSENGVAPSTKKKAAPKKKAAKEEEEDDEVDEAEDDDE